MDHRASNATGSKRSAAIGGSLLGRLDGEDAALS